MRTWLKLVQVSTLDLQSGFVVLEDDGFTVAVHLYFGGRSVRKLVSEAFLEEGELLLVDEQRRLADVEVDCLGASYDFNHHSLRGVTNLFW